MIIGVGLWNAYRGISQKFADKWQARGGMSHAARTWGERVGVVGHLARGVVFCLIGIFITKAALEFDPKDAIGLDGALHKLAQASIRPLPARRHRGRAGLLRALLPGRRSLSRRLGRVRGRPRRRSPERRLRGAIAG